ncbi:MAG: hypothetical protein HY689_10400 [Chloroflexi bacterium]|nr:hypothetical protein [Chloroflexota bacterium]
MLREYGITLRGGAYKTIRNGTATAGLVSSASHPGMWHAVRDGHCDCEGFSFRGKCSHIEALEATALVEAWEAHKQEREALEREAEELAARLEALLGKLAQAQEAEDGAWRQVQEMAQETGKPKEKKREEKAAPHADTLAGAAA